MTTTDWRRHATPEAQQAFADAQARLDHLNLGEDGYTREQMEADKKLTDRYERLVLQPAQYEFERNCDRAEFELGWPEPADDSRIEWEDNNGTRYGAYRQDQPEHDGGSWFTYGLAGRWSWERLVGFHQIPAGPDVILLVEKP